MSGLSRARSSFGESKELQNAPNVVMLLEQRDYEGRTPLHICALQGDAEISSLLLHSVGSTETLEELFMIRDKKEFSVLHSTAKVGCV